MRLLIKNATLVNERRTELANVLIEEDRICEITTGEPTLQADEVMDAQGCYLLPGVIDDHVHFRDPGLTHKADILSESRAAAAGGITSIMDMPNTNPQTTTLEALNAKLDLLNERCIVNHSCYFGATNDNHADFARLDKHRICGIKLFMGSSTGNMLVDRMESLKQIFSSTDLLIAAHCEDQAIISRNTLRYKEQYAAEEDVPVEHHPDIRSSQACYDSSALAVKLAKEAGARLHLLHISTEEELQLIAPEEITDSASAKRKQITAEACVSHLVFSQEDYQTLGTRIKCNPAIKRKEDRDALRKAVKSGQIDVIATDHAPHLLSEKQGGATRAMSGMPMIQFSLLSMLQLASEGILPIETVVQRMCHAPALLFGIEGRGFIRPGYKADLVLVRPCPEEPWTLTGEHILSKCGWSPLEGKQFAWRVERTWANGHLIYNGTSVDENYRGEELRFQ